jgi:hypothetical protein
MQKQQRTPLNEEALNRTLALYFPNLVSQKQISLKKVEFAECSFGADLLKALTFARRIGKLRGGLENIEGLIKKEQNGFEALKKRGLMPENQSVSRILFVSNDGSDRFYRSCQSVIELASPRILPFKLDCTSFVLGKSFFGSDVQVKCILTETREVLNRILAAISTVHP